MISKFKDKDKNRGIYMAEKIIKLYANISKKEPDRQTQANIAIAAGLFINIVLFAAKLFTAALTGSVAVMGDAVNNLSDSFSSLLSLVSFKLSSMPPDEKHPFGHARIEYIFSSLISMIIIYIAYKLMRMSISKIIAPQETSVDLLSLALLILSIAAKLLQSKIYADFGEKLDSQLLRTTALDSKSDVMSTSVIVISLLTAKVANIRPDGFIGVIVSLLIFKSAVKILMSTVDRIIGTDPGTSETEKISEFVSGYDGITGTHDLIVHTYGPGNIFASIHAEIDASKDVFLSHSLIDKIEKDCLEQLGVQLIIHMDPVDLDNPKLNAIKQETQKVIQCIDERLTFHDFRIVENFDNINIIFDVNLPYNFKYSDKEFLKILKTKLQEKNRDYNPIVTLDRHYYRVNPKED